MKKKRKKERKAASMSRGQAGYGLSKLLEAVLLPKRIDGHCYRMQM